MDEFQNAYRRIAFGALLVVSFALGFTLFLPFLPAILWATVLSVLTHPIYTRANIRLEKAKWVRSSWASSLASLWTTLLTLFIVCIPFLAIGGLLVVQIEGVSSDLDPQSPRNGTAYARLMTDLDTSIAPIA